MRPWILGLFRSKYKRKLSLYLTPEVYDRLQSTRSLSETTEVMEVVRRSLATYDFLLRKQAEGGTVLVRNPDGTEEEILLK